MKSVIRHFSLTALGLALFLVLAARPAAAIDLNGYFQGKYIQGGHSSQLGATITHSGVQASVSAGMGQTIDAVTHFTADVTLEGKSLSGSVSLYGAAGVLETVSTTGKTNGKGSKVKLKVTRSAGDVVKIKLKRPHEHH